MRRNTPPRAVAARFAGTSLAWAVFVLPPRTRRGQHSPHARGAVPRDDPRPGLGPPEGFRPEEPASWPRIDGRLEWVGGRLLYMPPCGWIRPAHPRRRGRRARGGRARAAREGPVVPGPRRGRRVARAAEDPRRARGHRRRRDASRR